MKNCVFTIVAKNYIGVAQILEKSLKLNSPNTDFFIFVADEFDSSANFVVPENVLFARQVLDISAQIWVDMSFKYDLTEFCTAIKPAVFQYLLKNTDFEKIIFLDPDIYIFSSFEPIFQMLDTHSVVITPHLALMRDQYNGELTEGGLMGTGVFNLGFCGIKRGLVSEKMLAWWHGKLIDKCYIDKYNTYFTDQKWIDFLPCFLSRDELFISRHLGMNIAPWNFFERRISIDRGKFMVSAREEIENEIEKFVPVIFVHYSGYNYKELKNGKVVQNNIKTLTSFLDTEKIISRYAEAIQLQSADFDRYIEEKYSFGQFENGDDIKSFHRRIYRSLTNKGEIILNPFTVGNNTFHAKLKKMGMTKSTVSNFDKATKSTVSGIDSKLLIFNNLTRFCYKIIGYEKYLLLIRLLRPFSRYESQIHLFSKKYDKENITF